MFKLAHLSDLHIGPLPDVPLSALFSKRFFGLLSWRRKRHAMHRVEVIEALLRDLADHPADHVAITGDLVNLALADEFGNAASWIARFGSPEEVSVIPGNHDAYVDGPYRDHWQMWQRYMANDGSAEITFPYVRRRGRVAIVGLSSAVPSPIAFACGSLGNAQLERLEPVLRQLHGQGLFIVILVHHPPLAWISTRRNLRDHAALADMIARCGGDLVLSGHQHRFELGTIGTPRGSVPVMVAPSSSTDDTNRHDEGGYIRLGIDPAQRRVFVAIRRYRDANGRFDTAMRGELVAGKDGIDLVQGDWPDTDD